jgi:transcriptional regulator with XRE-family HTH domain
MSETEGAVKRATGDKDLTHAPKRLKYRRTAAGLSLTQLAEQAGYSKAHISMLEDGQHHSASPECLKRLAEVLGCQITDLIPDEDTG